MLSLTMFIKQRFQKNKTFSTFFLFGFVYFSFPLMASAQTVQDILVKLAAVFGEIVPVVFALILLAFFWGVAKFVLSVGESGKTEGKKIIIWGVVALFLSTSIWGIVVYFQQIFGVQNTQPIQVQGVNRLIK